MDGADAGEKPKPGAKKRVSKPRTVISRAGG
jgi:hypothetical protein